MFKDSSIPDTRHEGEQLPMQRDANTHPPLASPSSPVISSAKAANLYVPTPASLPLGETSTSDSLPQHAHSRPLPSVPPPSYSRQVEAGFSAGHKRVDDLSYSSAGTAESDVGRRNPSIGNSSQGHAYLSAHRLSPTHERRDVRQRSRVAAGASFSGHNRDQTSATYRNAYDSEQVSVYSRAYTPTDEYELKEYSNDEHYDAPRHSEAGSAASLARYADRLSPEHNGGIVNPYYDDSRITITLTANMALPQDSEQFDPRTGYVLSRNRIVALAEVDAAEFS